MHGSYLRRLSVFHGHFGLLVLLAACRTGEPKGTTLHVRLVDEQGAPLTGAQGLVRRIEPPTPCSDWIPLEDGVLALPGREQLEPPEAYEVLVRASGFTLWRGSLAEIGREAGPIVLAPGRTFELALSTADARPVPESLLPVVFDSEFAPMVWRGRVWGGPRVSCLPVERYGSKSFVVSAPAGPAQLFVLIDEPGFLRAFQAGPITDSMIATGRLEVPLPAPATVRCRIERQDVAADSGELFLEVHRSLDVPGGGRVVVPVDRSAVEPAASEVSFGDLAPGSYTFSLVAGEAPSPTSGPETPSRKRIAVLSAVAYEVVLTAP
jgi:hypothetical protein